jgi:hypothetical protein
MLDERPPALRTDDRPTEPGDSIVVRLDPGRRRGRIGTGVGVLLVVAVIALAGAGVAALWNNGFGLDGLFGRTTIDRSAPVLVERLRNRAEFRGATGTFSATVDIENDHGFIPGFIAGDRTIYTGVGDVDATVSLRHVGSTASTKSDGSIVVTLPHATLGRARLDPKLSHVMSRDRGVLDRVGGLFVDSPTSDRGVERVALRRIERAAAKSRLAAKAERSTARMIRDLGRAVGADRVTIEFRDAPTLAR